MEIRGKNLEEYCIYETRCIHVHPTPLGPVHLLGFRVHRCVVENYYYRNVSSA